MLRSCYFPTEPSRTQRHLQLMTCSEAKERQVHWNKAWKVSCRSFRDWVWFGNIRGRLKLTESDRMRGYIQHTYCIINYIHMYIYIYIYTYRHTPYLSNGFFLCRYDLRKSRPSKNKSSKNPKIVICGKLPCFSQASNHCESTLVKFKGDIHHTSYRCSLPETIQVAPENRGIGSFSFGGRLGLLCYLSFRECITQGCSPRPVHIPILASPGWSACAPGDPLVSGK